MSGGQSRVESPNTRYSAIPNEKSTMSQSKKSIAFTPNQAQFCEIGRLTGSHPAGFLYLVDVIRYAMARTSGARSTMANVASLGLSKSVAVVRTHAHAYL